MKRETYIKCNNCKKYFNKKYFVNNLTCVYCNDLYLLKLNEEKKQ